MKKTPSQLQGCRCVVVRDLTLEFSIGILDEEKKRPQPVVINLQIFVPESGRATSTDIADYVSYADVVDGIKAIASSRRHILLLETLAEEIASLVLRDKRVKRVIVDLSKPQIIPEAGGVGVIIERYNEA